MQMYPPCVSEAVSEWLGKWLTSLVLVCAAVSMGVFALPLITFLVPFSSFKNHLSYDYFSCQTLVLCFFLTAQNLWFHESHLSIHVSQHIFHNIEVPWSLANFELTVHQHGELLLSILASSTWTQCCFNFLCSMLCSLSFEIFESQ